jgi:hypothetical protein
MYWEEDAATAAAFCTSSWASSMLCWALLPGTAVPLPPTPHGTAGPYTTALALRVVKRY